MVFLIAGHENALRSKRRYGELMTESEEAESSKQIPFVDYLVLGDKPYLVANECKQCQARYFDRRNACAHCFGEEFKQVRVATKGVVTSFTIVEMGPMPYIQRWLIVKELQSGALLSG